MSPRQNLIVQNGIGIAGLIIILIGVLFFSSRGFVPDERYYQLNVDLLRQYGLSDDFLVHLKGPAGPTYAVLHYILYPVTRGGVVAVRLVNTSLLACSIFLLNRILGKAGKPVIGWTLLSIPMTLVCGGLALTEMPALFFLMCCIFFMQQFVEKKKPYTLIIAGIFYSFSILGRQPYLLLFPVFIYYLFNPFRLRDTGLLLIFSFISLLLPAYCFIIWKAIIPATGNIAEAGGLAYNHFFLACGYCMLAFIFTIPTFIIHPGKIGYFKLILLLGICVIISVVFKLEYAIMSPIAIKLLPAKWFPYFLNLGFGFLIFMSIYFIGNCLFRFFESFKDKFMLVGYLSMLALLISTITITHQFSSRYVFQLSPFIFMAGAKFNKPDFGSNIFRTLGLIVGIFALFSYYSS